MRFLKNMLILGVGFITGGAAGVFLIVGCEVGRSGFPLHLYSLHVIGIIICANIGANIGMRFATRFKVSPPKPNSKPRLTPDAEQEARARFRPSSDTIIDDASIQPDKRGLKQGE